MLWGVGFFHLLLLLTFPVGIQCRGPIQTDPGNIALKKPTLQSSTYRNRASNSGRAVDGYLHTRYHDGSCTHTDYEYKPWWAVDLQDKSTLVDGLKITNRGDCCANRLQQLQVALTNSTPSLDVIQDGNRRKWCVGHPAGVRASETITLPCKGRGRYLVVWVARKTYLTLCEVQVFTDGCISNPCSANRDCISKGAGKYECPCKDSWHGPNCDQKNAAFKKPTLQSGTAFGRTPGHAVDEVTSTCIKTDKRTSPWWAVDLGKGHNVREVMITWDSKAQTPPRNVKIGVTYTSPRVKNPNSNNQVICARRTGYETPRNKWTLNCNGANGRWLSVLMDKVHEPLMLCEVVVFAEPVGRDRYAGYEFNAFTQPKTVQSDQGDGANVNLYCGLKFHQNTVTPYPNDISTPRVDVRWYKAVQVGEHIQERAVYQWHEFYDGKLGYGDNRYHRGTGGLFEDRYTITIRNVTQKDEARYCCELAVQNWRSAESCTDFHYRLMPRNKFVVRCDRDIEYKFGQTIPVSRATPALLYVSIKGFYPGEGRELTLTDIDKGKELAKTSDFTLSAHSTATEKFYDLELSYRWTSPVYSGINAALSYRFASWDERYIECNYTYGIRPTRLTAKVMAHDESSTVEAEVLTMPAVVLAVIGAVLGVIFIIALATACHFKRTQTNNLGDEGEEPAINSSQQSLHVHKAAKA